MAWLASERASSSESVFSDESDRGKKYYYKWDSHPTLLVQHLFVLYAMMYLVRVYLASLVLTTVNYGRQSMVYDTDTVLVVTD